MTKLRNGYVMVRLPMIGSVENVILDTTRGAPKKSPVLKFAMHAARLAWDFLKST